VSARPWGAEDPVTWAVRTGRIMPTRENVDGWRASLAKDPSIVQDQLASLSAVLDRDTAEGRALRRQLRVDGPGVADDVDTLYASMYGAPPEPLMSAEDEALYQAFYGRSA